jgi:hypothetical protein
VPRTSTPGITVPGASTPGIRLPGRATSPSPSGTSRSLRSGGKLNLDLSGAGVIPQGRLRELRARSRRQGK